MGYRDMPYNRYFSSSPSPLQPRDAPRAHSGPKAFSLDLFKVIVIVVADVVIIYSVYNSDDMYKRERNLYKYLDKKKKCEKR